MLHVPISEAKKSAPSSLGATARRWVPEKNLPPEAKTHQSTYGNQAVLRMLNHSSGASGLQRKCACDNSAGNCTECAEQKEATLQRRATRHHAEPNAAPPIVHEVLRSPGSPLDANTREFMESRFGYDFSGVRLHADARAAESARAVNALAYTVGRDIVFAEHQPASGPDGRQVLAHELAHVVQQSRAGESFGTLRIGDAHSAAEKEASEVARAIVSGAHASSLKATSQEISRLPPEPAPAPPVSPPNPPPPAAACANPEQKLSACIRPVCIANDDGTSPTTLPSFAESQAIWGKCCIDLSVNQAALVKKTAYKELDESPTDTPTAEETSLFAAAGSSGGCISVFVADTFKQGGSTGKDISGGGGTYDGGKAEPKVVVVEGIHPTIVAHELGHAMGYFKHEPAGTVMEVTASRHDQKESDKVAKAICDTVKTFTSGKKAGDSNCCIKTT